MISLSGMIIVQLHAALIKVGHVAVFAAALLAKLHDVADVFRRRQDAGADERLLALQNFGGVGVIQRGIDLNGLAARLRDAVDDVRRGRDEVEVVFALQALHDDLHVQQAQKAAAEAEAEGDGIFLRHRTWRHR